MRPHRMFGSRGMKWTDYECIRYAGCVAAAFALFSALTLGQSKSEGSSQDSATEKSQGAVATFRAHADLVLIPVTVTDTFNRFVLGFQKEDFHLLEDGVEQNVADFSGEDAPVSVGLLFDESGSMDYKLRTSRDAAAQLL